VARHHPDALCREAAVAALGAWGRPADLDPVLAATTGKPALRRRSAVALAAFVDDPRAVEALRRLAGDRDWQVREVAEVLLEDLSP
jgi:HEAT repeat protein